MALLTLQNIVDKAARRCGQLAEQLTTEQVQIMRENLFLLLSHEATRGLNLWKVNKYRHGITAGNIVYTLPTDAEDVLNINYVTGNIETLVPTGTTVTLNTQGLTTCQVIGLKLATSLPSTTTVRLQYSLDNTNWVDSVTLTTAAGWNYASVPVQVASAYWRLAAFVSLLPGMFTLTTFPAYLATNFYSLVSEIPMAPLNRDDYWNLPNKEFQSNRPLQYWFDRQNTQSSVTGSLGPQIRYWPVGNDETVHVNMLYSGRINDVTVLKLDQQIDVPERWMHYVIAALAAESALELPNVPLDRLGLLEQKAEKLRMEVYDAETDGMPIYWGPNISHYTR